MLIEPKRIGLDFLFKNHDYWLDYPDSFDFYRRHGSSNKDFLNNLIEKKQIFSKFKYKFLAAKAEVDLKEAVDLSEDYYGFKQIRLIQAAVVLAKVLGFNFSQSAPFLGNKPDALEYEPFVFPLNRNFFDCGNFFDCFCIISPLCKVSGAPFPKLPNISNLVHVLVGEKHNKFYFIETVDHKRLPLDETFFIIH